MSKKIYVPTKNTEDWRQLLADPEKHWKDGYSAKSLAECWENSGNGFPDEIKKMFAEGHLKLEMLLAIPEYQVCLDPNGHPSQNDIFVLVTSKDKDELGLAVIMVEGKVNEEFDKIISEWNDSNGKKNRFNFLAKKLEIIEDIALYYDFRYQLFHRTVSAILTAEKFYAKKAIMLVQSFSKTDKWFDDYAKFVKMLNADIQVQTGKIHKCKTLKSGIDLFVGWVKSSKKN
ncbi:MAG: hypothetical protein LBR13_01235 [Dysgonamonadaceae bacterium]|jgi:hypothetical protein|nr:hypothetical protein [Dysgonamonadaceae bacterium]